MLLAGLVIDTMQPAPQNSKDALNGVCADAIAGILGICPALSQEYSNRLLFVKRKMEEKMAAEPKTQTVPEGRLEAGKGSTLQGKTPRRTKIQHLYEIKNLFRSESRIQKLPRASSEGCVLVPFALTACIPEGAIRKFAAKEPFTVYVNDVPGAERFVLYFGDWHLIPRRC